MTLLSFASAASAAPSPDEPAATPIDWVSRLGGTPSRFGTVRGPQLAGPATVGASARIGMPTAASARSNAASHVHDLAHTAPAEIDALKASIDPVQRLLGHTIENARVSYSDQLDKGARIVVACHAGNGGQPVMTLMGPGFDRRLPARIHTHYHGDHATVADPVGSKAGQNARIRDTVARDPQTVFVLPECRNATTTTDAPTRDNRYRADWGNVTSQAATTDAALKAAGITDVARETVSVHGRGGAVIEQLMQRDPTGRSLRAQRVELHDASCGARRAMAAWCHTDPGRGVERVIDVRGSRDEGCDAMTTDELQGAYRRIDIAHQRPLDERNNPVVYDGKAAARDDRIHGSTGHEGVRRFHPDAHYQTTGRFLAVWPLPN